MKYEVLGIVRLDPDLNFDENSVVSRDINSPGHHVWFAVEISHKGHRPAQIIYDNQKCYILRSFAPKDWKQEKEDLYYFTNMDQEWRPNKKERAKLDETVEEWKKTL